MSATDAVFFIQQSLSYLPTPRTDTILTHSTYVFPRVGRFQAQPNYGFMMQPELFGRLGYTMP